MSREKPGRSRMNKAIGQRNGAVTGIAISSMRDRKEQGRARVSVVVAAYNEARHIRRLVQSLDAQTLKPVEVIVVDDGSTDGTAWRARYASADVLSGPHRGAAAARNRGARRAKGEVLVFLDGDMAVSPSFIERLVSPITAGEAVGTFTNLDSRSDCWAEVSSGWEAEAQLAAVEPGDRGALVGEPGVDEDGVVGA